MKTVLYTGYDESYKPLADLTVPLMKDWATKHHIDFREFLVPPAGLNIFWTGVARGLELLRTGYERVMYLDVDQMITNPSYNLKAHMVNFKHGLHVPQDWGRDVASDWDCSACCLIMHEDCIPILEEVRQLEPEYRDQPFQEQAPLRVVLKRNSLLGMPVYFWPRRPWNCVPDQVCPGQVPEPWEPGDFAAHLTMLPLEKRVELFHQFKKKLC